MLPAVYQRLDEVFPEFGFARDQRGAWVAKAKSIGDHGPLGTRPERVFVRLLRDGACPAGFGVHGGDPVPFCAWVLGSPYGHPKGADFLRAAGILAQRAGVEPGPLEGGRVDPEDMARVRQRVEAQRRADARRERRRLRQRVDQARELWNAAEQDPERVMAYLRGRGVAGLPGGAPRSLRYCARTPVGRGAKTLPAIVAAVTLPTTNADGEDAARVVAVHRIYLSEDGRGKNPDLPNAKLALGPVRGGAVRLGMPGPGQTLALTEGIETAAAVRAATGWAAWACISQSGLKALELPAGLAAMLRDTGGSVVVCGDVDDPVVRDDRGKTPPRGQHSAVEAAERLAELFCGLDVRVAVPMQWAPEEWRAA